MVDQYIDTHRARAMRKRAFDRMRYYCQWKRHEKRMTKLYERKMRQYVFRKVIKGWRDQVYRSKREAFNVANTKRCELEVAQLIQSKPLLRLCRLFNLL